MKPSLTLSFALSDECDAELEQFALKALDEVLPLDAEDYPENGEEIEFELADAAGQWVPGNDDFLRLFGQEGFQLLLLEQSPSEEWENYVANGGSEPSASLILYHVMKAEISARARRLAETRISEHFAGLGKGSPSPPSRPSSLSG